MTRIALGIEYDGSGYSGWQVQPHARSIQDELERAVASIATHPVELIAAGRTDAGVHALCQVAHFDTTAVRPLDAWVLGVNTVMPDAVSVLWAHPVAASFHARYSALSRSYVYRILNRRIRPALLRNRVGWIRRPLDAAAMHAAAQPLVGEHDFSAFRAAECQSSTPLRRVITIAVTRDAEIVEINVRANAFLHHMVRNIAGSLIAVGAGERPAGWIAELLANRDRRQSGVTAPPQGLYLAAVEYPRECGLRPGAAPGASETAGGAWSCPPGGPHV